MQFRSDVSRGTPPATPPGGSSLSNGNDLPVPQCNRPPLRSRRSIPAPASQFPSIPAKRSWLAALCARSEEHTSELQSQSNLVCRLLLEKKKRHNTRDPPLPLNPLRIDSIPSEP